MKAVLSVDSQISIIAKFISITFVGPVVSPDYAYKEKVAPVTPDIFMVREIE